LVSSRQYMHSNSASIYPRRGTSTSIRANLALIIAILLGSLLPSIAAACSSCGCTLSSDWETQGISTIPGLRLDLRYDHIDQNQLRQGTGTAGSFTFPNNGEIELGTLNRYYTISLDYSPSLAWGLNVVVPYIDRPHETITPDNTAISSSHTRSLGDVRVIGRYQGLFPGMDTGIMFGLKLPSGSINDNFNSGPDAGDQLDRSLQSGTGSTDLILGVYRFGEFNLNWGWFSQALFQQALNTKEKYRLGKSLNVNFGVRYNLSRMVIPLLQINAQVRGRDSGAEDFSEDTGGKLIYLSPGVTINMAGSWKLYSFVQVPLYQQVNELQLAPKWNFSIGVNHRL